MILRLTPILDKFVGEFIGKVIQKINTSTFINEVDCGLDRKVKYCRGFGDKRFKDLEIDATIIADGRLTDPCLSVGKEPDLLDIINQFENETVFYDIGANVGTYSIYAGLRGMRVFSFEPLFQNYTALQHNCAANGLIDAESVTPLMLALDDKLQIGNMLCIDDRIGTSDATYVPNSDNRLANVPIEQSVRVGGVIGLPLDLVIDQFALPTPNLLKLDVDGNEFRILRGSSKVLASSTLTYCVIECDTGDHANLELIIAYLEEFGFTEVKRYVGGRLTDKRIQNIHFQKIL
jgi:FkbM family methyltransferase